MAPQCWSLSWTLAGVMTWASAMWGLLQAPQRSVEHKLDEALKTHLSQVLYRETDRRGKACHVTQQVILELRSSLA